MRYIAEKIKVTGITITLKTGGNLIVDGRGGIEQLKKIIKDAIKEETGRLTEVNVNYVIPSLLTDVSTDDIVELESGKRYPVNALCLERNGVVVGNRFKYIAQLKKVCTKSEIWSYYLSSGKTVVDVAKHFKVSQSVMNGIINEYL